MNNSSLSDDALAELLTLTVEVDGNGTIRRYFNHLGQKHRVHGPAVIHASGTCSWWMNGQRHREDGPALTWPDGDKYWYLNGRKLTEEEWNERIRSM